MGQSTRFVHRSSALLDVMCIYNVGDLIKRKQKIIQNSFKEFILTEKKTTTTTNDLSVIY